MKKKEEFKEYGDNKPFYDKILKANAFTNLLSGKATIRVATAMVYERVGDTEYFLGGYPLLKGKYYQIGEYFVLDKPGKPYFVDCLGSDMFIPCKDPKLGKIVEFVKYSEDDFRVRTKVNKDYYCKIRRLVYDEEAVIVTGDDGEALIDEETGEPVKARLPKKDKFGNNVYEVYEEVYKEPKGVTQEGRDAIRIHNQTQEEIKKFREKNEGFWSKFTKHGGLTIVGLAIVVMGMLIMGKMMTDSWETGVITLSGDIKEANNNLKWWQQPDAIDKISSAVQEKTDEKNAPPIK